MVNRALFALSSSVALSAATHAGVAQVTFELYDAFHTFPEALGDPAFSCVSGDGRVAAGYYWGDTGGYFGVMDGHVLLDPTPTNFRLPEDISFDGRVIVEEDRVWTDGVVSELTDGFAFAISNDARVLGGGACRWAGSECAGAPEAVLWIDGQRVGLGLPPAGAGATVNGLSADGAVAVGGDLRPADHVYTDQPTMPWRYEAGAFTMLPLPPGDIAGAASQVSPDGQTIVGLTASDLSAMNTRQAVRWVGGQVHTLQAGSPSWALDVSADGTRIVGASAQLGAFLLDARRGGALRRLDRSASRVRPDRRHPHRGHGHRRRRKCDRRRRDGPGPVGPARERWGRLRRLARHAPALVPSRRPRPAAGRARRQRSARLPHRLRRGRQPELGPRPAVDGPRLRRRARVPPDLRPRLPVRRVPARRVDSPRG